MLRVFAESQYRQFNSSRYDRVSNFLNARWQRCQFLVIVSRFSGRHGCTLPPKPGLGKSSFAEIQHSETNTVPLGMPASSTLNVTAVPSERKDKYRRSLRFVRPFLFFKARSTQLDVVRPPKDNAMIASAIRSTVANGAFADTTLGADAVLG